MVTCNNVGAYFNMRSEYSVPQSDRLMRLQFKSRSSIIMPNVVVMMLSCKLYNGEIGLGCL